MKLEIQMSHDEVCAILEDHVRKSVLIHFAYGKDVIVTSHSYSGLSALVKVYDKPAKEDGE